MYTSKLLSISSKTSSLNMYNGVIRGNLNIWLGQRNEAYIKVPFSGSKSLAVFPIKPCGHRSRVG